MLQRATILATGNTVCCQDMILNVQDLDAAADLDDVVNIGDYRGASSFEQQIQDYKVRLAMSAVRENNGNKTVAARRLGISRAYLHRLLRMAETDPALFGQDLRQTATA